MAQFRYSVVRAMRTIAGVRQEGWIVERLMGESRIHASVLFETEAEANLECERLKQQEG